MKRFVPTIVATALLGSCASFPMHAEPEVAPNARTPAPAASEPVLYGRDGKPVGESGPTRGTSSGRDSQNDGGRYTLLELYQRALDQRDAFEHELEALRAELSKTQGDLAASQQALEQEKQATASQEAEKQRVTAENLDLAARLATAHIRRLQAEKALLQQRLLAQRTSPADETPASEPQTPATNEEHR